MAKMKIAVLFGGASSEHEVSLVSAYSVLTNIPKDKYDVMCIGITKKGHWLCYPGEYEDIRTGEWENNPDNCTAVISPDTVSKGVILLGADDKCYIRRLDAVFPGAARKIRRGRHRAGSVRTRGASLRRLRHDQQRRLHG